MLAARRAATAAKAAAPAQSVRVRSVVVRAAQPQQQQQPAMKKAQQLGKALLANLVLAAPALAEEGKLFDFNATLPVMAGEILLLMVFLDKFWFGPTGKVLDERDATLRNQLSSVKEGGDELDSLIKEAESLIKTARGEVSALVQSKKAAKQSELDASYAAAKAKVQAETDSAVGAMEKESEALLKALDAQADAISTEVLRRVLPDGVRV